MKPRAVTDPVDSLGATLADLQSRVRALEVVSHRHINTFGEFIDTTDQAAAAINTPFILGLNTTNLSFGVSVTSGNRITVETPGVYSLTFSLQLHNTGGGGTGEDFFVWIRRNGLNVANSASHEKVSNNRFQFVCVNYLVEATASNDYWEIVCQVDNLAIRVETLPASGNIPLVPSVIATLVRVPGRQ